jgi:hypothetical protein
MPGKLKKRKPRDNYVAMAYRIDRLPRPFPRAEVLEWLIRSAERGSGELPSGWEVTWRWQNKKGGPWREDSFQNTVAESRAQFLGLMGARLRRDLRSLDTGSIGPERYIHRRTGTDPEEEERDERAEARAEREAARKRKKRKALKRKRKRAKR